MYLIATHAAVHIIKQQQTRSSRLVTTLMAADVRLCNMQSGHRIRVQTVVQTYFM